MFPRDAAGSIDLEAGTGGITGMCSCDEFLEVYKEDTTFRVRTPDSIDPGRTNPHAPFVAEISDSVGSASPVVARVLLQSKDILDAAIFDIEVDKPTVIKALHAIKESLVICEKVANRVAAHVDKIVTDIERGALKRAGDGRTLNPFPQVPELEAEVTSFLINAKRAIQSICRLPALFLPIDPKDNNFDALSKTLSKTPEASVPLKAFVRENAEIIRYSIDLRNFQEHPNGKRTVIENFKLSRDGKISPPAWYVSDQPPRSIRDEIIAAVDFLIQMAEGMLIHLVMGSVGKRIPFIIDQIPEDQIEKKMPIRYRLSADISKMKIVVPDSQH